MFNAIRKSHDDMPRMTIPSGDDPEAIAARLKRVREVLGYTKREFAEKAGISEQVYGPFENAKRDLTLSAAKNCDPHTL